MRFNSGRQSFTTSLVHIAVALSSYARNTFLSRINFCLEWICAKESFTKSHLRNLQLTGLGPGGLCIILCERGKDLFGSSGS